MTNRAKQLFRLSQDKYNKSNNIDKVKLSNIVKTRLAEHNRGLKNIGVGYATDFVIAGKVFLRVNKLL